MDVLKIKLSAINSPFVNLIVFIMVVFNCFMYLRQASVYRV